MRKIKWGLAFEGAKTLWKSNVAISAALWFQCTFSFLLISIVLFNTFATVSVRDTFKQFIGDKIYYTLSDTADETGEFEKYQKSDNEYYKLKNFFSDLQNQEDFSLVSTSMQPIDLINSQIPDEFLYGYEGGTTRPPVIREDGSTLSWAKAIQLSENIFSEFGLSVESGRIFQHEDYTFNKEKPFPVILGSDYRTYFKLGDKIAANSLFADVQLEVVGFFPTNAHLPVNGDILYTDRYIMYPFFTEFDYEKDKGMAKIVLASQVNGEIITANQDLNVKAIVDELSQKHKTFTFDVYDINTNDINMISQMSDVLVAQIVALALILTLLSIVGISSTMIGRVKEKYYEYGIHLMSGATISDITYQAVFCIVMIVFSSVFVSMLLSLLIMGASAYFLIPLPIALLISVFASLPPIIAIRRIKVNSLIRRKE